MKETMREMEVRRSEVTKSSFGKLPCGQTFSIGSDISQERQGL